MERATNVSFFPGFLDPEGRPWKASITLNHYTKLVESALKAAALCQRELVIPIGYFFDNPGLQRLLMRYSGSQTEALCFRSIFGDLIRPAIKEGQEFDTTAKPQWEDAWTRWAIGEETGRGEVVYFNIVEPHQASTLSSIRDVAKLKSTLGEMTRCEHEVSLEATLRVLSSIHFAETMPYNDFRFPEYVKSRLLGDRDTRDDFRLHERILEKLGNISIAVDGTSGAKRLSRSLLHRPDSCREIGVREHDILTVEEYDASIPALNHYHQLAFATATKTGTVCSPYAPAMKLETIRAIAKMFDPLRYDPTEGNAFTPPPCLLDKLTFCDIYKIRNKHRIEFFEGMERMHDAVKLSHAEYRSAVTSHYERIASWTLKNLTQPESASLRSQLAASDDSAFVPKEKIGFAVELLRYIILFSPGLWGQYQKSLQIKLFLSDIAPAL